MDRDSFKHYSHIRRTLIMVLVLNWSTAILKILYGLFTHFSSMTADGFHSLSDGASNIIGLFGIYFACQPKDEEHPYGHKKYETLFSLGIAALLFFLAIGLVHESIERLHKPLSPQIDIRSFLVMLFTMALNFWVMRYEEKRAKILHSDILISDAMHTKADIFTSLSVIVALVVAKLGYIIIDPIATIIIALFIAHTGYDIIKRGSKVLCDTVAMLDVKKIEEIVLAVKGVKTCHKIRSRGRPDDIYIDLHVQVDKDMHMEEAHKISDSIEQAVKKGIPEVSDVVVHMEPK